MGEGALVAMTNRPWCGSCHAGILVMNGNELQRCDDCELFETDEDAAMATDRLLGLLGRAYREAPAGATVAGTLAALLGRPGP